MGNEPDLDKLWQKVDAGSATEQERVDAAVGSGKLERTSDVERLRNLLSDGAAEVRYFVFSSLILRLGDRSAATEAAAWSAIESDSDEDVRGMAATCVASILAECPSQKGFGRLVAALKATRNKRERESLYRALFIAARRSPQEWPGVLGSWRDSSEIEIDWTLVAELEDQVARAASERQQAHGNEPLSGT